MPFAKRRVEPQLLCRYQLPNPEGQLFEDLVSVGNVALSRSLRQLSDLARHACSVFQELEDELVSTGRRVRGLQGRIQQLQLSCSELDPKQEAVPESNLDVESKLTVHYQAPWHQQRNIFDPSTRPACVEELHGQASLSLWSLHRDQQRRRAGSKEKRVTISALPPTPMFPPTHPNYSQAKGGLDLTTFESTRSSSPTECCRFSPWSRKAAPSDPDADGVALGHRSKFPIPNIPSTLDKQTNWSKALPLPTPEERMKSHSQVINSCVIPINVTGVGFDRDASVRCSLVHSQSVLQRRRKLRRRRTVAGIPRQVQQDLDSDDSPSSRERTVIVHAGPDITPSIDALTGHLNTRDSGCQTEDFLISGAPSRRRIRGQRVQGVSLSLSHSAGNISCLPDSVDAMFTTSVGARLRSRSLPRDGNRMIDNRRNDSDDEDGISPFLSGPGELILKDGAGTGAGGQAVSGRQLGLKYKQLSESPERGWMERTRSQLPRKADLGSCEISSSSDTFSSPVHSVSVAGVLGGQMDHKDDHQSSSGNWSGSSSTCPSQTSETIPPAASPPLTGSSHCDSELSLNAATHTNEDQTSFMLDHYQGLRTQRAGSFSSTAMDILEEVGVSTPTEAEWSYTHPEPQCSQDLHPEPSREAESSLGCPSFTSMATCESSYSDKPPSEKADTVSHYSEDTEGYYTSMHFDCGLKGSKSFTYNYADPNSDCGLSELSAHVTLSRRCLSLRKPRAKPCPPTRSSSLRKICSDGNIPDKKEPKITCGQQLPLSSKERRLQMVLSGSSAHFESSSLVREPRGVWALEGMAELPDLGVFSSTDAHSFKDEGLVQSDYADLWLLNDLKSSDPYRSLSNSSTATGTTVIECIKSQESSESQTSGSRATTPSLPSVEGDYKLTSPEKLAGLASPSSGYSSQSETPTSSFPSAFFPGPLSPSSGKRKPKVPERKSSLSSLSLSSKRDPDLPMIPPSHLDLSALHSVGSKTPAHQNHVQVLQSKASDAGSSVAPPSSQVFSAHSMAITPTVLHSVQLRSIGKDLRGAPEDKTTSRVPCPSSTWFKLKSPQFYNSHHTPPKGSCDSMFISSEELAEGEAGSQAETWNHQDREAAAGPQSEPASETPESTAAHGGEVYGEQAEAPSCNGDGLSPSEPEQQHPTEMSEEEEEEEEEGGREEEERYEVTTVQHSSPESAGSLDEGPAADGQSESSARIEGGTDVEVDSSGVSTQSTSQDGGDESTEDFSKASTPSDTAASPLSDVSRLEDDGVFLSPTRARTTEDLFAAIHRSKRKVLGRKDSSELMRTRLSASSGNGPHSAALSPPAPLAPPSSAVTPPGPQRATGSIYRNVKKSSTSNEEFKLLLLKKGSRSDSGYRMSATEILKSPVAAKTPGESPTDSPRPHEELLPSEQPYSPSPRANAEGPSPKSFPPSAASRPGRSRIPPPANSSRYGVRGRLYSAPMQAISEGEAENSDGSPHDDRSSQDST